MSASAYRDFFAGYIDGNIRAMRFMMSFAGVRGAAP